MTTDSKHNLPIAPNVLNRDFYVSKTDEKYIEVFYNRERSHSANNNLSPVEFEKREKLLQEETVA